MPNLSIKDVPEELAEALRRRAAQNHRSLQGELMAIIQQAVQVTPGVSREAAPAMQGWRRGSRNIEEIADELLAKYPEPVRAGPLGVDVVRQDRDSR